MVSVLKGTVQVRDLSGQMATLQAGQQAPFKAGGLGARALFDVLQLGWRDGVLTAQNQPLGTSFVSWSAIALACCAGSRAWKRYG